MIINIPWLKEFLPDLTWDPKELAERATAIGHESTAIDNDNIDVEITPNRGDCLSVFGLARDLSGIYGLALKKPEIGVLPEEKDIIDLKVAPEVSKEVIHDLLVDVDNYVVQESPAELQKKLATIGLQSKNLAIDLTNIVAYEIGSPLHVFDYDKIHSGLELGLSEKDEETTLLDGKIVKLPAGCLVQRSEGLVVDLAGVMGGLSSAVDEKTTHFILQAAVFDVSLVRKTSKECGVTTPASIQYQKGVSRYAAEQGTKRFLYLLRKYAPGCHASGTQVVFNEKRDSAFEFDLNKINSLIGHNFTNEDIQVLTHLGYTLSGSSITPPPWRLDVNSNPELAEELARVVGLDKIKTRELSAIAGSKKDDFHLTASLRQHLVNLGLTETIGYSFTAEGLVEIANPFTAAMRFMRPSLQNSLLDAVSKNPYMKKIVYFEIGHVFGSEETPMLGLITPSKNDELFEKIEELLKVKLEWQEIKEDALKEKDIKFGRVYFAETPLMPLLKNVEITDDTTEEFPIYRPISKFPSIIRDVTLLVDADTDPKKIIDHFLLSYQVILAEVSDRYESEKLGAGKIALTFRIFYQDANRSMADAEADKILKEYLNTLSKEVQFTLR